METKKDVAFSRQNKQRNKSRRRNDRENEGMDMEGKEKEEQLFPILGHAARPEIFDLTVESAA